MAEQDSVRIELAFEGGGVLSAVVSVQTADEAERAVAGTGPATLQLDTQDGRITVVLARVLYLKRYAREGLVGFGI